MTNVLRRNIMQAYQLTNKLTTLYRVLVYVKVILMIKEFLMEPENS
jgi:hypothetical protein